MGEKEGGKYDDFSEDYYEELEIEGDSVRFEMYSPEDEKNER